MRRIYIQPMWGLWGAPMRNNVLQRQFDSDVTHVAFVLHKDGERNELAPAYRGTISNRNINKYNALMALILIGDAEVVEIER